MKERQEQKRKGFRSTGIVLEEAVFVKGKLKAKRDRRTFSSYVATLIERDLQTAA